MRFSFRLASVLLVCAGGLCFQAALGASSALKEIRFAADRGEWDKGRNWNGGRVPAGANQAAMARSPAVITLSSAVPEVFSAGFGGEGKGATLYIEDGALLKMKSNLSVGINMDNTKGICYMRGGEIEVGTGFPGFSAVGIGCSATNSGSVGEMTVSGGIVRGGIVVGSHLPNTGVGVLAIEGSAAKLVGKPTDKGNFQIQASGTVNFILDGEGVSAFDCGRTVVFHPGSALTVDASRYEGRTRKTIPLVTTPRLEDNGVRTRVVAAPPGMRAEIVVEDFRSKQREQGVFLRLIPSGNK